MDPIQISLNNIGYSDLQQIVEGLNAGGVQATLGEKAVNNTTTVTITVNGRTANVQVALPEIDPPQTDATEFSNVTGQLESLANKLSEGEGSGDGLCSLYELTELLLRLAQQQRKNASELRSSEHKALQSNLQSQAEGTRNTAASVASTNRGAAIAQSIVQVIGVGLQVFGGIKQMSAYNNSSAGATSNEIGAAQDSIKAFDKVNVQATNEVSDNTVEQIGDKSKAAFIDLKQARNEKAALVRESETALQERETAKGKVDQISQAIDNAEDGEKVKLPNGQGGEIEVTREEAETQLKQANQEYLTKCENVDTAQKKVDQATIKVADKAVALRQAMKEDLAGVPQPKKGAEPTDAQKAEKEVLSSLRDDVREGLTKKLDTLKETYENQVSGALHSKEMKKADMWGIFAQFGVQITQSIAGSITAGSHEEEGEGQAQGKELEAKAESHRGEVDKAKELQDQAAQLIQNVLEMARTITRMQHETMSSMISRI